MEQMASLPGIGRRTALRLVLHLMNREDDDLDRFVEAFREMKTNAKNCSVCNNVSDHDICTICANTNREPAIICVVEDIRDVLAIEATESFSGLYHVLGGIISPMDGVGPSDLCIDSLLERANREETKEIVFALSATMEGDTTSFYLYRKLANTDVTISAISRGVSVGSELQYADEITLGRSLVNRQPFVVQTS